MDNKPLVSPGKFGLKYGVLVGIVYVAVTYSSYISGLRMEGEKWPTFIYYIAFAASIFYAIYQYKSYGGGLLRLMDAIKVGVIIGVMAGMIASAYTLLFNYIIDPGFLERLMESNLQHAIDSGMSEEGITSIKGASGVATNPWILSALYIAGNLFFGLFYSLLGGLALRKEIK